MRITRHTSGVPSGWTRHWYKPGFWWWWVTTEAPATVRLLAPLTITGLVLAGGFAAAYALASGDASGAPQTVVVTTVKVARDVEVVTVSRKVTVPNGGTHTVSKVVYRTRPARTLPASTVYLPGSTVYQPGSTVYHTFTTAGGAKLVTVSHPVTVEVTRGTTVAAAPVTVTQGHVVTTQKLVTVRQTLTAPGRTVTATNTVVQPVTQVSTETDVVTTFVNRPAQTVTTTQPSSTVTRTTTTTVTTEVTTTVPGLPTIVTVTVRR